MIGGRIQGKEKKEEEKKTWTEIFSGTVPTRHEPGHDSRQSSVEVSSPFNPKKRARMRLCRAAGPATHSGIPLPFIIPNHSTHSKTSVISLASPSTHPHGIV